jgi:hypothetical protein
LRDEPRLGRFVCHCRQKRFLLGPPVRPQVLRVPLLGKFDDLVAGVEDRLNRAIVLLKGDDVSRGPELCWKI